LELISLEIQKLVNGIKNLSSTKVYRIAFQILEIHAYAYFHFLFCRTTYLPALKFAREQGLNVTLHCGEVSYSLDLNCYL